ncbi:lipopolysaccharide biosynthesis protein [Janibacter indicus]|uniref:lipopolysaccharide biosynthesis protein n=1 Tax=Janibacter indicus TaxID=857417 RepID=UPI003D9A8429
MLATGATVAQALPVALSPILTRIYSPSDFGVLALFVAVTTVAGSIATGRYEMAIMIADREEDAANLTCLCVALSAVSSVVLAIPLIIFSGPIAATMSSPDVGPWLLLAPLTVFFIGFFNALNYYNSRHKRFDSIARATASKSFLTVASQLALGAAGARPGGLVVGQALGALASNGVLLKNARYLAADFKPSRARMSTLAHRYRRFPILGMPGILANNLATQSTTFLLSSLFSIATVGYYSLVQRVLGLPSMIVGQAVSQVFFQAATEERQLTGVSIRSYRATTLKLVALGSPIFGVGYLASPSIFRMAFGAEWQIAGEYARILAPLFFVRFVTVGVSTVGSVFEKQGLALGWNLGLLVVNAGAVGLAFSLGWGVVGALWSLTVASGTHYVLLWFMYERVARGIL